MRMGNKILVVDDEPHLVEVMASRLRANQYEVVTAITGRDGIEKAREEKPNLILLDIMMLDMDGYGVLRYLKDMSETKDIPVIMMSVKKWSEDIKRAMSGGAVDYIVKPFDSKDLIGKLKAVLKNE